VLSAILTFTATLGVTSSCPLAAPSVLPELSGSWEVVVINGLDRPHPDTMRADATTVADLQACVLRERLLARRGSPPYESLALWGVNGADTTVQRLFVHSQHGRFGIYQGRRTGNEIVLRQMSSPPQPTRTVVEHQVQIGDRDHVAITSRISTDGGGSWQALSRSEYRRASR
jgi:hypothetical protein